MISYKDIYGKVVFVLACVTAPKAFPLGLLRILSLISSSTVNSSAACSDLQRALEGIEGEGACRFGLEPEEEEGDVKKVAHAKPSSTTADGWM